MNSELVNNVLHVGGVGSISFLIFIAIVGSTGLFDAVRSNEGKFKKEFTWKAVLGFSLFMSLLFTLLYWGNTRLIYILGEDPGMWLLWLNAFGIFFVVHLFDLIVLDYLIVVKWHPKFLKMPDTPYFTTFKPHLIGFFRGIPFGVIISFLVSLVPY